MRRHVQRRVIHRGFVPVGGFGALGFENFVDLIFDVQKLCLGEDVADLGGTFLAYVAWKRATAGKDLQRIDGQGDATL